VPHSAATREVAALVYLGGFTHAEVADILGIRPGAIKARLQRDALAEDSYRPLFAA
jgi:DNA-directed RNA polymerase specialized sigma24 family protein